MVERVASPSPSLPGFPVVEALPGWHPSPPPRDVPHALPFFSPDRTSLVMIADTLDSPDAPTRTIYLRSASHWPDPDLVTSVLGATLPARPLQATLDTRQQRDGWALHFVVESGPVSLGAPLTSLLGALRDLYTPPTGWSGPRMQFVWGPAPEGWTRHRYSHAGLDGCVAFRRGPWTAVVGELEADGHLERTVSLSHRQGERITSRMLDMTIRAFCGPAQVIETSGKPGGKATAERPLAARVKLPRDPIARAALPVIFDEGWPRYLMGADGRLPPVALTRLDLPDGGEASASARSLLSPLSRA